MFEQGDALASAELQTSYLSVIDYLVCVTKIVIWTLLEEPTCRFAKSPPLRIGRRMLSNTLAPLVINMSVYLR